jgi:ADP-ribose pyrophosphatase
MNETVSASRTAYRGRLLRVEELEVELPDGRRSVREVVRHPGAAVVLARHPDGRFALVRQYRAAVGETLIEAVAGSLNQGEDPMACAARELREETGHAAKRLVPMGTIYPAPGYTTEAMYLFYAELDPVPAPLDPDEDENVVTEWMTAAEIDGAIAAGTIRDAKTLAIWLLHGVKRP